MKKVLVLLVLATLFLHACATEKETIKMPPENSPSQSDEITEEDNTSKPTLHEEGITNKIAFYFHPGYLSVNYGRNLVANMKRYPDRCIYKTFSSDYMKDMNDRELFVSTGLELVEDPKVKVFVMYAAYPGTEDLLIKIRECRPDILIIWISSGNNIIIDIADIVLEFDEIGMIKKEVNQAHSMGAETIVYLTYPTTNAMAEFEDLKKSTLKTECSILDIKHVQTEPILEAGGPGGSIGYNIKQYGNNISFYYPNPNVQETVLLALNQDFIFIQQGGFLNIYYDFPTLLGIEIDKDHIDNFDWINTQIKANLAKKGRTGHFALMPAPFDMIDTAAAVEYATGYCDGRITEKVDPEALQASFEKAFEIYGFTDIGFELTQDKNYNNRFLYTTDYVVY